MAPGEAASFSSTHGVDEGPKHGTCLEAQSGSEMKCPVRANMRAAPQANPKDYAALSTYLRWAERQRMMAVGSAEQLQTRTPREKKTVKIFTSGGDIRMRYSMFSEIVLAKRLSP